MVFCHKLVVLGVTLALLAHSVSGGPAVATACITTCNTMWIACVGGITLYTWGAGFVTALAGCGAAQGECLEVCVFLSVLPTA